VTHVAGLGDDAAGGDHRCGNEDILDVAVHVKTVTRHTHTSCAAYMFFFIPEARVAIHPPTVLNSMLPGVSQASSAHLALFSIEGGCGNHATARLHLSGS
jgi:hypothetical protein